MRIGIITDIHENVKMLQRALDVASKNKCDELACLGDITGYDRRFYRYNFSRSASECIKLIKENFRWIVAGNHDLFSACRIPSWTDGFQFPDGWFRMDPSERKLRAAGRVWCYEGDAESDIDSEEIAFLHSLPEFIVTDSPGVTCLSSLTIFSRPNRINHPLCREGKASYRSLELHGYQEVFYSFPDILTVISQALRTEMQDLFSGHFRISLMIHSGLERKRH
jgi:predicted phosphodiesterase